MSKLITLPPCQHCGEYDLFLVAGPWIRLRCAECGYDSGNIAQRLPDTDLREVVNKLFAKYEAAHE